MPSDLSDEIDETRFRIDHSRPGAVVVTLSIAASDYAATLERAADGRAKRVAADQARS